VNKRKAVAVAEIVSATAIFLWRRLPDFRWESPAPFPAVPPLSVQFDDPRPSTRIEPGEVRGPSIAPGSLDNHTPLLGHAHRTPTPFQDRTRILASRWWDARGTLYTDFPAAFPITMSVRRREHRSKSFVPTSVIHANTHGETLIQHPERAFHVSIRPNRRISFACAASAVS
jgi:hypothetical protein